MIENIRRYTGLIFIVIVLLLLGFVFMDTSGFFRRSGTGGTVVTIEGRAYSASEFRKLGASPYDLIPRLGDYRLYGFLNALHGDAENEENRAIQFFTGRILLRDAREEFGIHPSDEAVDAYVREIRGFQTPPPAGSPPGTPGDFNAEAYRNFSSKTLGSYGMVERDFRELIRDVIALDELRALIGGGLEGSRRLAEAVAVERAQQIEASVASIEMEPFREQLDPSDEELKEWWETRKGAYTTEQKVKVSYVLASPEYPEEIQDKPKPADAPEKTEEEQAAEDEAKAERADKRKEIDKQIANDTDNFITRVNDTEGKAFEEEAEKLGWEVKSTDWITRATLPADLRLRTRSSATGTQLAETIFSLSMGPDPLARYTNAIPVGEAQFLVVRLDEFEESREKTFEEAKDEVREQYIAENAGEALEKEVEEKTAALKEAIAGGKSFDDAAKELGLEPRKLGPWGMSDSLDNEFNARQIFQLASTVNPGDFAEPFISDDRAVIIHVDARQVIKDDNRGQQIDQISAGLRGQLQQRAFDAWLRQRIQEAQVTTPQRS